MSEKLCERRIVHSLKTSKHWVSRARRANKEVLSAKLLSWRNVVRPIDLSPPLKYQIIISIIITKAYCRWEVYAAASCSKVSGSAHPRQEYFAEAKYMLKCSFSELFEIIYYIILHHFSIFLLNLTKEFISVIKIFENWKWPANYKGKKKGTVTTTILSMNWDPPQTEWKILEKISLIARNVRSNTSKRQKKKSMRQ